MPGLRLQQDLQLHFADLDDVVCLEFLLFSGRNAGAVDIGPIAASQVLDYKSAVLADDDGVLARRPNAVRSFVDLEIDVYWLFVSPSNKVLALEYWILCTGFDTTNH